MSYKIIIGVVCLTVALALGFIIISSNHNSASKDSSEEITSTLTNSVISERELIRMDDLRISELREKYLVKMICDTARAYNIPEAVLCGLGHHESGRFKVLHTKIKDSNNKFSYGLFQIQLGTAVLYEGSATEEKLLDPTYNLHLAAVIFKKNMEKHGSVEKAIAAHNGCIKDGRITNPNYMKEVYSSIGVVTVKYGL